MTPTLSVIISSHGDPSWRDLAWNRAAPSVQAQEAPHELITGYERESTVARVRNDGASRATGTHLVFLDADDELADGYLAAMLEAAVRHPDALLAPRVQYVRPGRNETPRYPREVPVQDGNWLVIGTGMPAARFRQAGGFEEWPIYEDWALFARIQRAGCPVVKVPDAVYRAHRRPRSRNHSLGRNGKLDVHDRIRRAVFPELYA